MFLKCIIASGIVISVLSLYAAPARKISTTRVGQLEAEYRTATQPRKDQIIQELTSGGFGLAAQQIVKRYAPARKQEQEVVQQQTQEKPNQAAVVVQPVAQPDLEKPAQITEQQRVAQEKEHAEKIKQYTTQFERVQNAIGNISGTAKTTQGFDAMSEQIDDLAAFKAKLQIQTGDIKALRVSLQNHRQAFIQKQKKEQSELAASIGKVVDAVKGVKDLDQVKKVRDDINAERLKVGLYALEQVDKDRYLEQLRVAETALLEKENNFLQQQTEQAKKERAERERIAQEKVANEAALKAEQEKKQKEHEEQERQKKIAALVQDVKTTIEEAGKANTSKEILEQRTEVLAQLEHVKESAILPDQKKNELGAELRKALGTLRSKENDLEKKATPAAQAKTTKQTITVPSFAGGDQSYDVQIITDAAGNITHTLYNNKPVEQLSNNQTQRNNLKWIGAEIQASKLVEQFSTMKTGVITVKTPLQGVITSMHTWQTNVEGALQGQQESEQGIYFNEYLKPALAEKIRRLEAQQ